MLRITFNSLSGVNAMESNLISRGIEELSAVLCFRVFFLFLQLFYFKNVGKMSYTYETANQNDVLFCYTVLNSVQFATIGLRLAIWL